MDTDKKGCSTCPAGKEHYENFRHPSKKNVVMVQYDYRTPTGNLFTTVAKTLEEARQRRDEWLTEQATTYRLWDNFGKLYFRDLVTSMEKNLPKVPVLEFKTSAQAEKFKDDYLDAGNYPDQPHSVIKIHKFVEGKFVEEVF